MKKLITGVSLATLVLGASLMGAPRAMAAEGDAGGEIVTQAELARILVRVMGLARYLAPGAPDYDYFAVLGQNGVYPKENWEPGEPVELGLLARLMVMALRLTYLVEDIDDYNACMMALEEAGIPIKTVGVAMAQVRGINRFQHTTGNTIGAQVDPIVRRDPRTFNPGDEWTGGVDADGGLVVPLGETLYVIKDKIDEIIIPPVIIPPPSRPRPPDRPVTPVNPIAPETEPVDPEYEVDPPPVDPDYEVDLPEDPS